MSVRRNFQLPTTVIQVIPQLDVRESCQAAPQHCGGPQKLDRSLSFRISSVGRYLAWHVSTRLRCFDNIFVARLWRK